ncbi:hypothetical protein FOQG_08939 [Fusarium oxysporum f. sp. raphani 54005]|uniref:Uncharacterized protein n=3 Tax=Fusarium oxysporum TaxID=5507 RepID=X0C0E3_FUSOX|nr:hypothetical protein FOVG_13726 [Fusarium oxysporum f. sp. pisi HDV247]EXK87601.1 hypothetical protein FOQG_08939 [Fusarium oxysporum f. sp. raphani 54005]EXL75861.1 hypothetical protein FOPG_09200 [Fusarium oxysporum f. sp. conglutinans race 2 54008]WKT52334.1 hypothetical protein QSH57_002848 [Fusarium oxysporum f. sp. vasinfectum]
MATGLPVRWAEFMDYALVYSATAKQNRRIEDYGKDTQLPAARAGGPFKQFSP